MLRDIYLYGPLESQFGHHHRFAVDSVAEAVRAIQCHHEDFYSTLKHGSYHLVRGEIDGGDYIGIDALNMRLGQKPIHIIPIVTGGKGDTKGIVTAVAGLALVATAVILSGGTLAGLAGTALTLPAGLGSITYGQLALMGGLLALSGVYQVVAPQVQVDKYDRDEQPRSYLFNGPTNRTEEGGPFTVIFGGPIEVGSVTGSIGINERQLKGGAVPGALTVTITCSDHGTVDPIGTRYMEPNSYLAIKFFPDDGYKVSGIDVNSTAVTDFDQDEYTLSFVTSDTTVHVTFGLMAETDHVISTASVGPGIVSPFGETLVDDGDDFTVHINPNINGALQYLVVDGTIIETSETTYTFENVDDDHTLVAHFTWA